MAQNFATSTSVKETEKKTLIDKLVIAALLGLAAVGGWSILGLVYAGLTTIGHII